MLKIDEFITYIDQPLVLLGTGGGVISTRVLLRSWGLQHRIACVTNDLADLRNHPNLPVITARLDFDCIAENMRTLGLTNPLFYHASFWPYLDDEPFMDDARLIASFYKDDPHTQKLISAIVNFRVKPDLCRVQPYASMLNLFTWHNAYWTGRNALQEKALSIIDGGAFTGDTLEQLLNHYNTSICDYYAFEPMPNNFVKLKNLNKANCYNLALYNQNATIAFAKGVPTSARAAKDGNLMVTCQRLDDMNMKINGKLCIKLDIEGAELEALQGAAGLIKKHRPHLAICAYHKVNDLYKIPQYIKSIVPGYEFTLTGGVHTVCYGQAK